jgi:hypothetical protein
VTVFADNKMPTYKVKVKWGKELFQDVEVNTEEEPILFKVNYLIAVIVYSMTVGSIATGVCFSPSCPD